MLRAISSSTRLVRPILICVGRTARCDRFMFVVSSSLMPKIAPTANTPAAMLNTASRVRILLCQRSNQTLYQITPISDLHFPPLYIFLLMPVSGLAQRLTRDLGLVQQFVELLLADRQYLPRSSFRGADRGVRLAVMQEGNLAKGFAGTQLQNDHIRLIGAGQHDFHSTF